MKRFGKFIRWGGVVCCVLLMAAWASSLLWHVYRASISTEGLFLIESGAGELSLSWIVAFGNHKSANWHVERIQDPLRLANFFSWPLYETDEFMTFLVLPYWLLLSLIAVPTVLLFWLNRIRIPPGHCRKCGYDLTGNVTGKCPECGADVPEVDPAGESS